MNDQPEGGVAASIDATYAIRQPVEYCGHEITLSVSQVSTECVLRPGHSGSHANHEGARWRLARLDTPAGQSALERILADAEFHTDGAAQAKNAETVIAHSSMAHAFQLAADYVRRGHDAELDASQRRAVRIQTLLDDTRDRMRKLAAELAKGTHWDGNEPEIGERIIAALHQPKEANPIPDPPEPDSVLHAEHRHPDWGYATTQGPRKQWDDVDVPPCDDQGDPDPTWERNTDAGRDGWERFDYTEESYWRRRKTETPDA